MKSLTSKTALWWTFVGATLVVLGLVATGALHRSREAQDEGWPGLPESEARCSEQRDHAAHAARAALAAGKARMQRYAFAPRDGLIALDRLAEAAECARTANEVELATEASQQLERSRARVDADARDHFRRYLHLMKHDRLREAASDIAFLLELGWPERGALADRLRRDGAAVAGDASGEPL